MSWFKLFSAVLVANIVSWFLLVMLSFLIFGMSLSALSDSFSTRSSKQNAGTVDQMQDLDRTLARQYSETVNSIPPKLTFTEQPKPKQRVFSNAAIATNKRVCEFWTEQARKDGLAESQAYKESACLRYRKSLTMYK